MARVLGRLTKQDVPVAKTFALNAVFERERAHISGWLTDKASENLESPDASDDSAKTVSEVLQENVRSIYASDPIARNPIQLSAAEGRLVKEAPSLALISAYSVTAVGATISEIALAIPPVLSGDATPYFLLPAAVLAIGGILAAFGVAGLIEHLNPVDVEAIGVEPKKRSVGGSFGLFLAGAALVAVGVWWRVSNQMGAAMQTIVISTAVALMIAVAGGLALFARERRRWVEDRMFECQVWHATDGHKKQCTSNAYKKEYEAEVDRIALKLRKLREKSGRLSVS
jgi:hypothetical protein